MQEPVSEGNGELLPPENPRKCVLRMGIYTVERDSEGRYHLSLPDGKREEGLNPEDLKNLARILRKLSRMEKEKPRA